MLPAISHIVLVKQHMLIRGKIIPRVQLVHSLVWRETIVVVIVRGPVVVGIVVWPEIRAGVRHGPRDPYFGVEVSVGVEIRDEWCLVSPIAVLSAPDRPVMEMAASPAERGEHKPMELASGHVGRDEELSPDDRVADPL
jgi:hypothetical protein